jgi:tetratricopeptide (TPR) repeat protein
MNARTGATLAQADALEAAGRRAEAEKAFLEIIERDPANAVARFNYACFLRRSGRPEDALVEHQAAIDLGISQPEEVLSNMAVIHTELRHDGTARLLLQRALETNPNFVPALFNLALYHEEFGDRRTAFGLFRRVLDVNPFFYDALVRLAHAERVTDPEGEVVKRLRRALRRANLDALTRESLHFALGKALDDCARYDEAFEQYALGNRQSRARLQRYDRDATEQGVTRIIESIGAHAISAVTPVSDRPLVFVTGNYRSGSTLFEQVLAAHPRVTAGGELDWFMRVPLSLDPKDWKVLAEGYLAYLERSFPGADIVTNKRPDAFGHLGMLRAMFPNARFVNTVRDPRDIALSVWFQQFAGRLGYAADLADIAHHYRQYARLMAHWRGLFGDSIFDADYDAYVQDPRGVTARLLAFLGLEWHEGCLDFHKNPTRVRTASVTQVREPLYRSSSGRWRNYERQLSALALDFGDRSP